MIRPDTLRRIDRWAGVPTCFLLSRAAPLFDAVARRRRATRGRDRTLFIGLAEMGSAVLADPALRRIGEASGQAPLFAIFEHNRDSLSLTGSVGDGDIFSLRAGSLTTLVADLPRFMHWARRRGVEYTVDLDPCSRFSAVLALLSGARIRTGFSHRDGELATYRGRLFTHPVDYAPGRHIAANFLALAEMTLAAAGHRLGRAQAVPMTVPCAPIGAEQRRDAQARLLRANPAFDPARHRVVLINPGCGDLLPQRRWPEAHHLALAKSILAQRSDVTLFLTGSADDAPAVQRLVAAIGDPRCASIAGSFALPELPALFACATALVTSDSGPAHFASVSPIPVVVLFGPESPARYRPLGNAIVLSADLPCSPCVSPSTQRASACRDNRCMQALDVGRVLAEVTRILDYRPAHLAARA